MDLEVRLESVRGYHGFKPFPGAIHDPATMAADILFTAYRNGDIAGMKILDLRCGTGMFSIGAWLLGARMVVGYDTSESALKITVGNVESSGAEIKFHKMDVREIREGADTVFMNPPFGCQSRNADRAFLEKAMEVSECVYFIHIAKILEFVEGFCESCGRSVAWLS